MWWCSLNWQFCQGIYKLELRIFVCDATILVYLLSKNTREPQFCHRMYRLEWECIVYSLCVTRPSGWCHVSGHWPPSQPRGLRPLRWPASAAARPGQRFNCFPSNHMRYHPRPRRLVSVSTKQSGRFSGFSVLPQKKTLKFDDIRFKNVLIFLK